MSFLTLRVNNVGYWDPISKVVHVANMKGKLANQFSTKGGLLVEQALYLQDMHCLEITHKSLPLSMAEVSLCFFTYFRRIPSWR